MHRNLIESQGVIKKVIESGGIKSFWIRSPLSSKLKPDQSVSHDGVCLTVEEVKSHSHRVTAIEETLQKTTLIQWQSGHHINLERCMKLNARLDGHLVQGHVDTTGVCIARNEREGSTEYIIGYPETFAANIIEKGSITVNGISLTAYNVTKNSFDVAIIPYTRNHTTINELEPGKNVNLEFDMLGKYFRRIAELKS